MLCFKQAYGGQRRIISLKFIGICAFGHFEFIEKERNLLWLKETYQEKARDIFRSK
jgi:hypothetical protein